MSAAPTLPAVLLRSIGEGEVTAVDGRQIHAWLRIKKDFTSWAKAQIKSLGLVEGVDFALLTQKGEQKGRGGHNARVYVFTLDIGKHVAMASHTPRGMELRQHFIDAESAQQRSAQTDTLEARSLALLSELAGVVDDQKRQLAAKNAQIEADAPKVRYADDLALAPGMVSTAQAVKIAGIHERLNREMWAAMDGPGGYFVNRPGQERHWRAEHVKQGLGDNEYKPRTLPGGGTTVDLVPKWTAKGTLHLRQWVLARRRQPMLGSP